MVVKTNYPLFVFAHEKENQSPLHSNHPLPQNMPSGTLSTTVANDSPHLASEVMRFYVKISALRCWNEEWRWSTELTNDASLPASSAVGPYYGETLSYSLSISAAAPTFAIPHVEKVATSKPRDDAQVRPCEAEGSH